MYYVFLLAPNLTPSLDMYFLQKLLNLKGDDGFVLNEVLVSLWYIMGLWPLVYSMLLLPTGRSFASSEFIRPMIVLLLGPITIIDPRAQNRLPRPAHIGFIDPNK
ncbi:hypothetical protein QJS04_geneDACA006722 [Acorus gramineus]|uniref:Uncharacterized protein n=1 Tax=Acorus gramineus TaxID=55184 RepID=A0AAV9AYZ5_ACOGR|nr:hypothetical protein QJS04_geneDACA006722 [Acorus gramineus]